jgi:hypothetical protein
MDGLYQWDRHSVDGCQGIVYLVPDCSVTDVPYLHDKRGEMKYSITWLAQSVVCILAAFGNSGSGQTHFDVS